MIAALATASLITAGSTAYSPCSSGSVMADGTRTLSVGNLNWDIISGGIKRIIEVPEDKIAEDRRTRTLPEIRGEGIERCST